MGGKNEKVAEEATERESEVFVLTAPLKRPLKASLVIANACIYSFGAGEAGGGGVDKRGVCVTCN